jgi:anhydro-N-acetylmuramic acid kinase
VNTFIQRHGLEHKIHFIASHGHTVFHEPAGGTTVQIGDGATLAAITGLPVIADLRALDVALGGQGAPIVPIGDRLLFADYPYLLNIGGIANLTIQAAQRSIAFDVCPANAVLNVLAQREGQPYDAEGRIAESGSLLLDVLAELNAQEYYRSAPPKSLSNEAAQAMAFPAMLESQQNNADLLNTFCHHIAEQVAAGAARHGAGAGAMLVTGGGAFNSYLVSRLEAALEPLHISVTVPDERVAKFKEALVMALIGTLRWREESNVLSSVTGASRNSVGGAIWMGQEA